MGKIDDILAGRQDTALTEVTSEEALKHLVGDDAKYATVEDMAKAMLNGQLHISQIEKENAEFRDSTNKAKGVEDILAAIAAQKAPAEGTPPVIDQLPVVDSEKLTVAEQITAALAKRDEGRVEAQADDNVNKVITDLEKLYGKDALVIYQAVGKNLGLDLSDLARKSPEAVMKLVADARPASTNNTGLQSSTHTTATPQVQAGVLNSTAIDKMFSEGKLSRHEKIALENEMLTLMGRDFFN